jgi:hypothetical protein
VYPVNDINPSIPVVTNYATDNGIGGQLHTAYTYSGLKADRSGRGLLGFASTTSTQTEANMSVVKTFSQTFPYTGSTTLTQGYLGAQLLSASSSTPACQAPGTTTACTVAPGNRYFVYNSQSVVSRNELNGAAYPTTTTTSQFGDGWGNETQTATATSDGYSATIVRTFANDVTNWLLGRQTQSQETRVSP